MNDYFLVHEGDPNDHEFAFYKFGELKKIYHSFGNPTVKATCNLLKKSNEESLDKEMMEVIKDIYIDFMKFKRRIEAPRRFKLTVGSGDL